MVHACSVLQKCLQFELEESVWEAKQRILAVFAKVRHCVGQHQRSGAEIEEVFPINTCSQILGHSCKLQYEEKLL